MMQRQRMLRLLLLPLLLLLLLLPRYDEYYARDAAERPTQTRSKIIIGCQVDAVQVPSQNSTP